MGLCLEQVKSSSLHSTEAAKCKTEWVVAFLMVWAAMYWDPLSDRAAWSCNSHRTLDHFTLPGTVWCKHSSIMGFLKFKGIDESIHRNYEQMAQL